VHGHGLHIQRQGQYGLCAFFRNVPREELHGAAPVAEIIDHQHDLVLYPNGNVLLYQRIFVALVGAFVQRYPDRAKLDARCPWEVALGQVIVQQYPWQHAAHGGHQGTGNRCAACRLLQLVAVYLLCQLEHRHGFNGIRDQ